MGWGWQAMPMLEQAMIPLSRWQMTQRSVHTAQPARPDWVEPPAPAVVRGAGPSSSVAAGDEGAEGGAAAGGGRLGGGASAGASAGGGAAAVGGAVDGAVVDGAAAAGCPAGGSAAAASSTKAPASANATARPTVMRVQAWVHEPRSIVLLPRPAGRSGTPRR
jgi:hypothetical protein